MKFSRFFASLCAFLLTISFSLQAQTWPEDRSVEAWVNVDSAAPFIELNWTDEGNSQSYSIFKRAVGATVWPSAIATLAATATSYTDTNVSANTKYEYAVVRVTDIPEPQNNGASFMQAYSFINAGFNIATIHNRGTMLLLYESSLGTSIPTDLEILQSDLAGDGWDVVAEPVPTTDDHFAVKAVIDNVAAANNLQSIYILGDVAVPYSGHFCTANNFPVPPDGHGPGGGDHCGAWPADVYYGIPSANWTDAQTTNTATTASGQNLPGDGKFDQTIIPATVEYAVGRVDLSDLPAFNETDASIHSRYITKTHEYRQTITNVLREGVIENNAPNAVEGFAAGAWRDFSVILGPNSTIAGDVLSSNATSNYLFSYGIGGGSFTSANGVGNTNDLTTQSPGIFNFFFGSFFGDWDNTDNFLRASIATLKNGLINIWNGRPFSLMYPMGLGCTTGESVMRSQNNTTVPANIFLNVIHISLMGDPSLRSDMFAPPTNLLVTANGSSASLSWTASTGANVSGYHVYNSSNPYSGYTLLNSNLINGTSYTHSGTQVLGPYFMVRAERLEETGSGTYFNLSQGAMNTGTAAPCYTNLTHPQLPLVENGIADYEAEQSIVSEATINAGAVVDYDAADYILLQPGFEAVQGTNFEAFIDGCNNGAGGLNN